MRRAAWKSAAWTAAGASILGALVLASLAAPEFLSRPNLAESALLPFTGGPILGTDIRGIPITEYALQGAGVVTMPALVSALVVAFLAIVAGLARCAAISWADTAIQLFSELVGALPRLVVVLVVALAMPAEWRSLFPIGVTWALLAAPGAMDEAASTAGRLGGAKFVEALRAHGFTATRIYLYHIVWLNLRGVIVRQSADIMMQVVFLEIALSYLAESQQQPSLTHQDSTFSWARLLYDGYTAIVGGLPLFHELFVGITLVAATAFMAQAFRRGAQAR